MAVTFSNNWENILNKVQNIFRSEFKGTLNIYIGVVNKFKGNNTDLF